MTVEQGNVFQRLWTRPRLIWPNPFHRGRAVHGTRFSAPDPWKSRPHPVGPPVELGEITRVVPIMQTEPAAGITVTLISLETYDCGFLVHGQFPAKHGERSLENQWMAHPTFTVSDDTGTEYRWWQSRENGTRFMGCFAPALNPNAHELRFTVTHIKWIFFNEEQSDRRYELDEGPWSFRISLD